MKSKPITILAVTIILIAGISFFFIKPVVTTIWASWKDLEKSHQEVQNVQEKKQVLQDLKNNPQLKNVSGIALKYIPVDSQSGQLVIELTAIANANKLVVEQTSLDQKTATTPTKAPEEDKTTPSSPSTSASAQVSADVKELKFSMSLSGAYNDFINFLKAIDSSSRLISLKNITIQKKESAAAAPAGGEQTTATIVTFGAQISGSAYYKTDISVEKNIENLKVSDETIQKFLNLKSYGLPINLTTEAGFGRGNPFEGY
ncbi:MAG: hypothetical protein HW405_858 [Candidatus Berkelbacteria bacterium]|nr:hypothetical protein [Candidatus Berkelbacteria bacterium]